MVAPCTNPYNKYFTWPRTPDKIIREKKKLAKFRRECRKHEFYDDNLFEEGSDDKNCEGAKMVYKSAYQRFYRGPKWDDFSVQEYQQKMKYRNDRRSVEHRHQPWLWESDSEDDNIEEIVSDQDGSRGDNAAAQLPAPTRNKDRNEPVQAWLDRGTVGLDKRAPEKPQDIDEDRKLRDATYAVKRSEAKQTRPRDQETSSRPRKHRSPERRKNKERQRNKRVESPSRTFGEKLHNPPFLPYGWANDGPAELRKTHNVLASQPEVYPAALRAAKRRQQDVRVKVKAHEEAIRKKDILPPPVVEESYPYYPKGIWTTEYQRNFCKEDDIKRHFFR